MIPIVNPQWCPLRGSRTYYGACPDRACQRPKGPKNKSEAKLAGGKQGKGKARQSIPYGVLGDPLPVPSRNPDSVIPYLLSTRLWALGSGSCIFQGHR